MPIPIARHRLMREMNEMAVMTVIRQHGPISRRHIAEITGLTKSTVTVAVQRLFSKHVLKELDSISTGPGRPERLLGLNSEAGYLLGSSIDATKCQVLLFDLQGKVLDHIAYDLKVGHAAQDTLKLVADAALVLLNKIPHEKYWGFGVSIPGIISAEGLVIHAPNLKWHDIAVGTFFNEWLPNPIYVVNDAQAGAIAEYYFGNALTSDLLLYLSLGMGIGGGVVMNGNLLIGAHGTGTEVGHMVISDNGPYCRCGRRGCFEAVASLRSLTERAMRAKDVVDWLKLDQIVSAFHNHEPWARQAVEETFYYLREGIVNLANIFDPDTIVLGGDLSRFGEDLRAQVEVPIESDIIIANNRNLTVRLTSLDDFTSALGAGAMALNTMVSARG